MSGIEEQMRDDMDSTPMLTVWHNDVRTLQCHSGLCVCFPEVFYTSWRTTNLHSENWEALHSFQNTELNDLVLMSKC